MSQFFDETEEALIAYAFDDIDRSANGTIDASELQNAATRLGVKTSFDECANVISNYAANQESLTRDEFVKWWHTDREYLVITRRRLRDHLSGETELRLLRREVHQLRSVLDKVPDIMANFYMNEAVTAMKNTQLFSKVPEDLLRILARNMKRRAYAAGDLVVRQGEDYGNTALVIASGTVNRYAMGDAHVSQVSTFCSHSIGLLHLYDPQTARFNAICETDVVGYIISRHDIDEVARSHPELSQALLSSLSSLLQSVTATRATPLLEQKAVQTSYTATTLAAIIESFYRSAMNSAINQRIMGGPRAPLFPVMHIQTPTRVVYINGIKQIRSALDGVKVHEHPFPNLSRLLLSFAPGVIMCPMSSILEATNVGHKNPEPMATRWMRGFAPRLAREVIFGVGLNQLADYIGERSENVFPQNRALARNLGSMAAGLVAGYLSHIPHVLSAKKLVEPNRSYPELWADVWKASLWQVPDHLPKESRRFVAQLYAIAFPIGCLRRSAQIAGTFVIINGTIYVTRNQPWY